MPTVYRRSSGSYLSLTGGTQVPNQVNPNPHLDKKVLRYLNPAAFEQPAIGTFGNMDPRNVLGFGTWAFEGNQATALNSNIFGQIEAAPRSADHAGSR